MALQWIRYYLTERTQQISNNGHLSLVDSLVCGVSQCSVFRLLSVLLCTAQLFDVITKWRSVGHQLYSIEFKLAVRGFHSHMQLYLYVCLIYNAFPGFGFPLYLLMMVIKRFHIALFTNLYICLLRTWFVIHNETLTYERQIYCLVKSCSILHNLNGAIWR